MSSIYFGLFALLLAGVLAPTGNNSVVAHVSNSFSFTLDAPLESLAPLFGAERERAWAAGWDPRFFYPHPPRDGRGVVFQVKHPDWNSTWITTIYEPQQGHIQHVYFVPDTLVCLIDIHLTALAPRETTVEVTYERTALNPELNEHVRRLGEQDANFGKEWKAELESYLHRSQPSGR